MACSLLAVADDGRQKLVELSSLARRDGGVGGRGEEWVGEVDLVAVDLDDARSHSAFEPLGRMAADRTIEGGERGSRHL